MRCFRKRTATVASLLFPLCIVACGEPVEQRSDAAPKSSDFPSPIEVLPQLTIAYAGDTILGRRMNSHVLARGLDQPLRGVKSLLEGADVAVVNVESMLSRGGTWAHKRSRGAVYLRGRPELVRVLTSAGVDVALAANDHSVDYGLPAMLEYLEILRRSGIDPIGAGSNRDASTMPVWREVGDTVVAFIGIHTSSPRGASEKNRAGTNFVKEIEADKLVKRVNWQVRRARRYAHVVVLVIHWGLPNSSPEPSEIHRELARRFVREAGIDALLGSSANVFQGIEIIDGRPIVYDAGNLLLDWPRRSGKRRWHHQSGIFLLHANRTGVVQLEFVPTLLGRSEVRLAGSADQDAANETLERLQKLSEPMGTRLLIDRGRAYLPLRREKPHPRPKETYIRPEPSPIHTPTATSYIPDVIVPALPETASPLTVTFEGGIELLGVELPERVASRDGLRVTTYWRTTAPVDEPFEIVYRVHCNEDAGNDAASCGAIWQTPHQPADWLYPMTRWKPGEIVRDSFFVKGPAKSGAGEHVVEVGLAWGGRGLEILTPVDLVGNKRAVVGTVDIEPGRVRRAQKKAQPE